MFSAKNAHKTSVSLGHYLPNLPVFFISFVFARVIFDNKSFKLNHQRYPGQSIIAVKSQTWKMSFSLNHQSFRLDKFTPKSL